MRRIKYLWALVALVCLSLLITAAAQAAAVGRFTQVQGQVDVLHHGKIPAVAAKLSDGVEPGDVIRTKAQCQGPGEVRGRLHRRPGPGEPPGRGGLRLRRRHRPTPPRRAALFQRRVPHPGEPRPAGASSRIS